MNSCSKTVEVVESFIGDKGTLFAIEAVNGKDVSVFSANPDEEEVILMPGSHLRCKSGALTLSDRFFVLHLEEVNCQR